MGLISRVSSRTYRFKNSKLTIWAKKIKTLQKVKKFLFKNANNVTLKPKEANTKLDQIYGVSTEDNQVEPKVTNTLKQMKTLAIWDRKTLDTYLTNPSKFIPGTKMVFAGMPKKVERKKLISFLETCKD